MFFMKDKTEELLEKADFSKETNQKARLYAMLFGRVLEDQRAGVKMLSSEMLAAAAGGVKRSHQEPVCPVCGGTDVVSENGRHKCRGCGNEW